MDNAKNTGVGRMRAADTPETVTVTLTVKNGAVEAASCECSHNAALELCADTLCRAVTGFPATDLFQMNNNVIYFNLEQPLPRQELYLASMCVLAAKRAAADWCRKNGVPCDYDDCHCD